MSDIDWSKAPEAATHFWTGNDHFYIEVDGKFYLPGRIHDGPVSASASWIAALIPRPSPAWIGEGLPPAGTVCEALAMSGRFKGGAWVKCKVVHIDSRGAFIHSDELIGCDCIGFPHENLQFRPIRTPEQIAADERELRALDLFRIAWPETHRWSDLSPHWHEAFYRLADSAYRKQ